MADQRLIILYEGHADPNTIILRELPVADVVTTTICLHEGHATPTTIILRDPTQPCAQVVADDGYVPQPYFVESWQREENDDLDYLTCFQVIPGTPLEDTVATDDDYAQPVFLDYADVAALEADQQPGFWAQGPPDQDDEPVINLIASFGDEIDDDQPFAYWQGAPDQDDEPPVAALVATPEDETDDATAREALPGQPLEDEPAVDATVFAIVFDLAEDGDDDVAAREIVTGSPLEDAPEAPAPVEDDRGKGGWDPYWYKPRRKTAKKRDEVERFLEETAQIDAPEAIQDTADAARDAAQEYLALADTSLQREAQRLLAEALDRIDAFYEAARMEAERLRQEDEDDDDDWLLLS